MWHREISTLAADYSAANGQRCSERGIALIIVLLSMLLLSALGIALSLTTSTETRIAASSRWSTETFYAADAGAARAIHDLSLVGDWNDVLSGAATSTFVDGVPGPRTLPDGSRIDMRQATDLLNCGHVSCRIDELSAVTVDRPWGSNNPIWQLYAHAPAAALSPSGEIDAQAYIVVWVADDPLDNDGLPLIDGDDAGATNPGRGLVQLRAQAYGPDRAVHTIEVTLRRAASRVHILSWRDLRQ